MNVKTILKAVLPPILTTQIIKIRRRRANAVPDWHTIKSGLLEGCEIFVQSQNPLFNDMIKGTYEEFFQSYLSKKELNQATVCDIGGYIGYHSLLFAKLVGANGRVIVFEPNRFNYDRLSRNVFRNIELAERISLRPLAIADFEGETQFHFSPNIEDETSLGGYIDGSCKPLEDEVYDKAKFTQEKVIVTKLDNLLVQDNIHEIKVIKIDVEGGEHKVLAGATEILRKCQPILLIEIHTVSAMLEVCRMLIPLGYEIEILKEDSVSRCFIAATH